MRASFDFRNVTIGNIRFRRFRQSLGGPHRPFLPLAIQQPCPNHEGAINVRTFDALQGEAKRAGIHLGIRDLYLGPDRLIVERAPDASVKYLIGRQR